jgi:hypothetical protein
MLSGQIFDTDKNFNSAYLIAAVCLLIAAGLTFVTRPPKAKTR